VNRGQRDSRNVLRISFESGAGHRRNSEPDMRLKPSTDQDLSNEPRHLQIGR
jgi:hypothetical protein